jgi:glycosyltransferase involved in cell wall biosynthesis
LSRAQATPGGAVRIGVLVDNYNYARFLEKCVGSISAQTRRADQVVVVDDGSTDDSLARLHALAATATPPVTVVAKPNGGQLSAFIAGAAALDCDIVCLLDSDDEFEPGHLAGIERAFAADPATDVVFSGHAKVFADGRREPVPATEAALPPQRLETIYLLRYCGGPTSTIAIRREALARVLPDADLPSWRVSADAVLVLRAAARGLRRRTTAEPTVIYRIHGQNLFHGRRLRGEKRARLRTALAALVAPERAALDAADDATRVAAFRQELDAAPRSPTSLLRFARLALVLPAAAAARAWLLLAYVRWLLVGGRGAA